jgi:hypothetical protein
MLGVTNKPLMLSINILNGNFDVSGEISRIFRQVPAAAAVDAIATVAGESTCFDLVHLKNVKNWEEKF